MARRCALLDLSASRLELTVLGGEKPFVHAQRICIPDMAENWPGCLESIVPQLSALVRSSGAMGLETTVLYQAPTSAVIVAPVHAGAGRAQAQQAAMLALADAANRPLATGPHDLDRIWTDPESKDDQGTPRQAHFLGVADTDEAAAAMARCIRAAGLNPVSFIPAEAPGLSAAVDSAIERSTSSTATAVTLYIGEHASTLAAATAGRLRLVRRIGIGSEMLIDALARELRPASPDAQPVTLDRAQAADALFRNGIPLRGKTFDESLGINADAVLPLLQPVLQRGIVEIKQSLRFGLDERERAGATVVCLGMGARVGRLINVIAEPCGLTVEPSNAGPTASFPTSTAAGVIKTWTDGRRLNLSLLPSFLGKEQTAKRIRRGMMVGFGVAAAFVVYSAVTVRMDLAAQHQRVESARASLDASRPMTDLNLKMIAAQTGVANARQRIASRLSLATSWDGAMFAMAQCTPASVKISECQMLMDQGKPVCRIVGQTPMPTSGDANATLRGYLDALNGIPLVRSTRLGATQRIDTDRGPIQSFEMTISLYDLPAGSPEGGTGIANAPGGTP